MITLVALALGIAVYNMATSRTRSVAATMQRTPPQAFFSDPLQVQLAEAVDRGDVAGIEASVQAGGNVNARGKDGYSLLYWAMARDRVKGFETLVQHGADVTSECRDPALVSDPRMNNRPIQLALRATNPGFLSAILRQGFDPDFVLSRSGGETLLFGAIFEHSESSIETLLNAGASIDRLDRAGYSPIVTAAEIRDYRLVWLLLCRGADPTAGRDQRKDLVKMLKSWGSRGVRPDQREYFEKVVDELVRRGLLTRQDIVEADKAKTPNAGITVIEHAADSEAGQAILQLDQRERDANASGRRE